jgi:hypothetical protein
VLAGEERARAPHAAHHLVEDQQHAVTVADLTHGAEVAGHRRHRAHGRADHRFGNEGDHRFRTELLDGRLQLSREAADVGLVGFVRRLIAIGVAWANVGDVDQERLELAAPRGVAADGQRAERVAVIALPPGDEAPPLRLADLDEVLARYLERRLDRLGAAGCVVYPIDSSGARSIR